MIISFLKQEMIISKSFLSYVLLNYFHIFQLFLTYFTFISQKNFSHPNAKLSREKSAMATQTAYVSLAWPDRYFFLQGVYRLQYKRP